MEIYNFYQMGCMIFSYFSKDHVFTLTWAIIFGAVCMAAMFILQGVGLFVMAKRRNLKKKWLAFVPFANIYYMGKLAGECGFFGHKMKNAGLYAMIAQIVAVAFTCTYIWAECYLYFNHGVPQQETPFSVPYWPGLTGFSLSVSKFYDYCELLLSIIGLAAELLLLVLVMGLYKKYQPKNYMGLSMLTLFIPMTRFIALFVLRDRPAIDYDEYMRARREAYMRRQQQQYGGYGNPYNPPYGNPYNRPYGQGGYGEPYGQNQGQRQPPKPEDPFEEFPSEENKTESGQTDGDDGFFN